MEAYKKALAKDPKAQILFKHEVVLPSETKSVLMSMVGSILGQQLSIQVAKIMRERFLALYGGKNPTAQMILDTPSETIKGIGISQSKTSYIKNVAQFFVDHKITLAKLKKMENEEIIDLLVQIKGVGRWTVEMLLIFALKREDVFALDDLGIQKGMIKLFKIKAMKKKDLLMKIEKLSRRWSPYRSFMSLHLWRYSA